MKSEHTFEIDGKQEHAVRGKNGNWVFDNPVVEAISEEGTVFMSHKIHCTSCLSEQEDGYYYFDACCCTHGVEELESRD